jgi:ribosomal protein L24E
MATATTLCSICGYRIEPGQTGVLDVEGRVHHLRCEPPLTCAGCGAAIAASDPLRREGDELLHAHCESTAATDRRRRSILRIRIDAGALPRDCPPDASAGYSLGNVCSGCGDPIAAGTPEYAVEGRLSARLHMQCYNAWREESVRAASTLFDLPCWTAPGVPGLVLAANAAVCRRAREAVRVSRRTRARSGELWGEAQQLVIAVKRVRADRGNGATEAQPRNPVV